MRDKFNIIVSFLIVIFTSTFAVVPFQSNENEYVVIQKYGAAYKLYEAKDAVESYLKCSSENATVFYPSSKDEARDVFKSILKNKAVEDRAIWIGFLGIDHQVHTIDKTLPYTNWGPGQPNTTVALSAVVLKKYVFEVRFMYEKHNVVCKKRLSDAASCRYSNRKSDDGYVELAEFGASYKHVGNANTHCDILTAFLYCAAHEAEVFYPESESESERVFESVVAAGTEHILIGVHDYFRTGAFRTMNGRTDFTAKWASGHPEVGAAIVFLKNDTTLVSQMENRSYANVVCKRRHNRVCTKSDTGNVYGGDLRQTLRYYRTEMSHYDAAKACREAGGSLVAPRDKQQLVAVLETFSRRGYDLFGSLWLGFDDALERYRYTTLADEVMKPDDFTWAPEANSLGRPSGCGFFSVDYLMLNITDCEQKLPFICQVKSITNAFPPNTRSYTYHPIQLSWLDAREYCRDRKETLATPYNYNDFIQLINGTPFLQNVVYLGYHNLLPGKRSEMVALKGYLPLQNEVLEWASEQVFTNGSYCLALQNDKKFLALDCDSKLAFVCERSEATY